MVNCLREMLTYSVHFNDFFQYLFLRQKNRLSLQLVDRKAFVYGNPSSVNPDLPLWQQADILPYNLKLEVPRESIILGEYLGKV